MSKEKSLKPEDFPGHTEQKQIIPVRLICPMGARDFLRPGRLFHLDGHTGFDHRFFRRPCLSLRRGRFSWLRAALDRDAQSLGLPENCPRRSVKLLGDGFQGVCFRQLYQLPIGLHRTPPLAN
jgi:hypothetical protein